MANLVFTNKALSTMKDAAVSEKTAVEVLRHGSTNRVSGDLYSCMKKYGSYDLYVNFVRKSDGTILVVSVKRRSNTRNLKHW